MSTREIINNINLERIKWCCAEESIELNKLAEKVKIPLSKIESVSLTYNQLKKIANFFGYGVLFFLNPDLPNREQLYSPAFRSIDNTGVDVDLKLRKLFRQVESHRDLYLDLQDELNEREELHLPILDKSKNKAKLVRDWLGVTTDNKYNYDIYRELIESKGILVFQSNGCNGKWQVKNDAVVGFCIKHNIAPVIFVCKNTPERKTFTLFHELAHILLHPKSYFDNKDNLKSNQDSSLEKDANSFAAQCLIPNELQNEFKKKVIQTEPRDYYSLFKNDAKKLGISVEVIIVMLLQLKCIQPSEYTKYKLIAKPDIEKKQKKNNADKKIPRIYRHLEPKKIFGTNYVSTVFNALYSDNITLSKASDYLDNININDIKSLGDKL